LAVACDDDRVQTAPPHAPDQDEDDERERRRLTIALLACAAAVQLAGMLAQGVRGLADVATHFIVVLPAAGFAIGLWRGLRMRVGIVAFALMWSGLSVWAAIAATRYAAEVAHAIHAAASVPRWFVPLVAARSVAFTAAAIVLLIGRPHRARRAAGAALGGAFLALFVAEHVYQFVA
jgi:hypothetical protein